MLGHKEAIFDKAISGTYVAFPLHIGGRVYLGTSTSLFFEGWPQYNLGIFGSKVNLYGYEVNYFDRIKDRELGVSCKLGFEFMERFQIGIGGYYGLTEALDSGHNINYGISLAFWL